MPARIVVVDNDADFLDCLTGALTQGGDNVAGFRNAGAALKALEATKSIDVLVTGIGLDGPQGLVCRSRGSLKQRGPVRKCSSSSPGISTCHQRRRRVPVGPRENQ